ncbi:MAG: SDR family NAD(P)-dependent oxidoreductase [Clostridiales bacterium]|nr:SDR family NAD(P)-dependent oxidoreductase [Clostridiales bacterium]
MYAFITGATSGIGLAFANFLSSKGYHLILVARNKERLTALQTKLQNRYPHQNFIIDSADLSDSSEALRIAKKYCEQPLSLVIQCAGFGKWGNMEQIPLEEEYELIQTNVTAVHILTKYFAAHMEHGTILNVASLAGFAPTPLMSAYAASKSYVIQYSLALDYELKKMNRPVRIAVLCPGPINTGFQKRAGCKKGVQSISCNHCVRYTMKQIEAGKRIIIPGFFMRCTYLAAKFFPVSALLSLEYQIQSKKSR